MRTALTLFLLSMFVLLMASRSYSAPSSQVTPDFRSSMFAFQTGWMSFGQLWFSSGR